MTRFDHPLYSLKHGFKELQGVAHSTPKAIVFSIRRRLPSSLSVRPSLFGRRTFGANPENSAVIFNGVTALRA